MFIILITEQNVDGCGGFANYLAAIDHEITQEEQIALNRNLSEVVAEDHEDWGTDDFCEEALNRTFGADNWKVPGHADFEF